MSIHHHCIAKRLRDPGIRIASESQRSGSIREECFVLQHERDFESPFGNLETILHVIPGEVKGREPCIGVHACHTNCVVVIPLLGRVRGVGVDVSRCLAGPFQFSGPPSNF